MHILFKDKINAVKTKVSIVKFLNDEGFHLAGGTETQIKCFNHEELRPSARVYSDTNTVFCWVCNKVFDVLSAYQSIHKVDLTKAVEDLISRYNVHPEQRPQQIQEFYQLARTYGSVDTKHSDAVIDAAEKSFRQYYASIRGWEAVENVIGWCWSEFDPLRYSRDLPQNILTRCNEWLESSVRLVGSYKQFCEDIVEIKERARKAGLR